MKYRLLILRSISVLTLVVSANACATYNGLKPIDPEVGHPAYYTPKVDSLQPTLKWSPTDIKSATYDLAIFEGPVANNAISFDWLRHKPAKIIYQRMQLSQPEHKVEEPLKPGNIYFWSVKVNDSENAWSSYNYHIFAVIIYQHWSKIPFRFETPTK